MRGRSVITVVVAAIVAAFLLTRSRVPDARPDGEQAATPRPPVELRDVAIVLRHAGHKQGEVRAERVTVSQDHRSISLTGRPRLTLISDSGDTVHAQGVRIVIDRDTGDVTVDGPVHATTSRGDQVVAGAARWNNRTRILELRSGVRMWHKGRQLRAEKVLIDTNQLLIDLVGNVEVWFPLDGVEP
jgi:hypothetical protein